MGAFMYQNGARSRRTSRRRRMSAAVNFYVGLLKTGLAAHAVQLGAGWCGQALGKGKSAIIFEGNWVLPYMKSTYPERPLRRSPDDQGQGAAATSPSPSRTRWRRTRRTSRPPGRSCHWLTGKKGQKVWMSKGLSLPSRSDVKSIGGREAVPPGGAVRPWLGLRQPELQQRLHGDGQRPDGGDLRQQDDAADAVGRRESPQGSVVRGGSNRSPARPRPRR